MNGLGWLFLIAGGVLIAATKAGWYDEGRIMRRLDLFNAYGFLARIGGGVRRLNYGIGLMLIVMGLVAGLAPLLRKLMG